MSGSRSSRPLRTSGTGSASTRRTCSSSRCPTKASCTRGRSSPSRRGEGPLGRLSRSLRSRDSSPSLWGSRASQSRDMQRTFRSRCIWDTGRFPHIRDSRRNYTGRFLHRRCTIRCRSARYTRWRASRYVSRRGNWWTRCTSPCHCKRGRIQLVLSRRMSCTGPWLPRSACRRGPRCHNTCNTPSEAHPVAEGWRRSWGSWLRSACSRPRVHFPLVGGLPNPTIWFYQECLSAAEDMTCDNSSTRRGASEELLI